MFSVRVFTGLEALSWQNWQTVTYFTEKGVKKVFLHPRLFGVRSLRVQGSDDQTQGCTDGMSNNDVFRRLPAYLKDLLGEKIESERDS
jgi:hypothetical protein